jgi:hypothetical protein
MIWLIVVHEKGVKAPAEIDVMPEIALLNKGNIGFQLLNYGLIPLQLILCGVIMTTLKLQIHFNDSFSDLQVNIPNFLHFLTNKIELLLTNLLISSEHMFLELQQ